MTWQASDLLTTKGREPGKASADTTARTVAAPDATPLILDDTGVPMLPTVAAGLSWDDADADAPARWPQDMERELMAEGFVNEREWQYWAKICRRGIVEQ